MKPCLKITSDALSYKENNKPGKPCLKKENTFYKRKKNNNPVKPCVLKKYLILFSRITFWKRTAVKPCVELLLMK